MNNQYERCSGTISVSVPKLKKDRDTRTTVTTKLADNLGLTFGGKNYALLDCFSDGLTYIIPSMQLYDEGFSFSLDGYEARVYWNIRQVEDTYGSYERLWRMYGRKGISNISKAVALLRLEPLFRAMEPLRSQETLKHLKDLVNGRLSRQGERDLLLSIAECYTTIPEVYETLEEPARGQIRVRPVEIEPKPMVKLMRTLASLFRDRNGKAFSAWASADSALALTLASALVIRPCAEGLGIKDAMEEADRLLVDSFFEYEFSELGFGENERRAATHGAAVLIASSAFYRKGEEAIDLFAPITSDSGIQDLTQCNEYQGEIWYNKEQMQRVILLTALSFALTPKAKDFEPDGYIRTLFEKEAASGYKLRELLRKNDEPEEDDEEKED